MRKKKKIKKVRLTMTPEEENIIKMGLGIIKEPNKEIDSRFALTRERIRQIEAKALGKLQNPARKEKLLERYDLP